MKNYERFFVILLFIFLLCWAKDAFADGHYAAGVINLRDLVMPPKGFYYEQYNPFYYSDGYYNDQGKKLKTLEFNRSIRIFGFPIDVRVDANIDLKIKSYAFSPTFIYSTGKKILGANYGFFISPSYGYLDGKLDIEVTKVAIDGIEIKGLKGKHLKYEESRSGMGDLYVVPIWLDWSKERFDIFSTYGFYAPVGQYDEDHFLNIGQGFWSHELSLGGAYYLTKNKATAFVGNLNYEINGRKRDLDLRPGQNLGFEYGISQYLSERLEVCLTGYSVWQTTNDSGSDSRNKKTKDYVHGVGAQLGYWFVKDKFNASLRYTYEYKAKDRFKGQMASLNLTYVF